MKKIEIKVRDLSPLWIKIIGILIFLATGYKVLTLTFFDLHPLVYLIFNAIAIATWTGRELVVVDFQNGVIREGFRILGITQLDTTKFLGLEKIYINKVRSFQTLRNLTRTIDIHFQNYKAFLKTTEGVKICIGINADKEELIKTLKKYNEHLKTDIFDNTLPEPLIV